MKDFSISEFSHAAMTYFTEDHFNEALQFLVHCVCPSAGSDIAHQGSVEAEDLFHEDIQGCGGSARIRQCMDK
jgi:hypothetical protein